VKNQDNIAVIIINYRTPALVSACLQSLQPERNTLPDLKAMVVDNGSQDNSVKRIAEEISVRGWDNWVCLLSIIENHGFSYGSNFAIKTLLQADAPPDFILLLNPDAFIEPDAVRLLAEQLQKSSVYGVAGSRVERKDDAFVMSALHFPSPVSELLNYGSKFRLINKYFHKYLVCPPEPDNPCECEWVSGACFMFKREVWESIGGFDEGFFLYFEDIDFCRRAYDKGWRIWYVPDSRVTHLEGVSTKTSFRKFRRPMFWHRSRRRYFLRYYGFPGLMIANVFRAIGGVLMLIKNFSDRTKRFVSGDHPMR
jgi:GT2 family glycosyltransferase